VSAEQGTGHPLARRLVAVLATVLVVLAGMIGLLLFFNGRDDAGVSSSAGPGREFPDLGARHLQPGERPPVAYNASPPVSGAHVPRLPTSDDATLSDDQLLHALELGNVVLVHGGARGGNPPAPLMKIAEDLSGPFDPALVGGGQAVIIARRPGVRGVLALAWRHQLAAPTATDPRLGEFAEYWLGRGAGT